MTGALVKRHDRFAEATIDSEVVLMDIDSGRFLALKATAATIWALIDGQRDRTAILASLTATFDGAPEAIERDLDAFLGQLRGNGLVA